MRTRDWYNIQDRKFCAAMRLAYPELEIEIERAGKKPTAVDEEKRKW